MVEANVSAQVPGQQRMLVGGIAANEQGGRGCRCIAKTGDYSLMTGYGAGEGRVVRGALVVDVVGLKHGARELLEEIIFFVGGAVGAENADCLSALAIANGFELGAGEAECILPGGGLELA